jgi:opacity protein-like surface antigen
MTTFTPRHLLRAGFLGLAGLLALAPQAAAADVALALEGGYSSLTNAPDTADALFGGSGGVTFGGTVRLGISDSFYVAGAGRYFTKDGERVALGPDNEVFPLGHPLELRIVPLYGTIGYRFNFSDTLIPYVGVGGGIALLHEESEVGGETESEDASKGMFIGLAGVEYGRGSLRFGGELGYSLIPDSLGDDGVGAAFDESDLGGFSAVAKVIFTF